jgi:hypothetical protein
MASAQPVFEESFAGEFRRLKLDSSSMLVRLLANPNFCPEIVSYLQAWEGLARPEAKADLEEVKTAQRQRGQERKEEFTRAIKANRRWLSEYPDVGNQELIAAVKDDLQRKEQKLKEWEIFHSERRFGQTGEEWAFLVELRELVRVYTTRTGSAYELSDADLCNLLTVADRAAGHSGKSWSDYPERLRNFHRFCDDPKNANFIKLVCDQARERALSLRLPPQLPTIEN